MAPPLGGRQLEGPEGGRTQKGGGGGGAERGMEQGRQAPAWSPPWASLCGQYVAATQQDVTQQQSNSREEGEMPGKGT